MLGDGSGVAGGRGDATGVTCADARRSGEARAATPAASDRTRRRETEAVRNEPGVIIPAKLSCAWTSSPVGCSTLRLQPHKPHRCSSRLARRMAARRSAVERGEIAALPVWTALMLGERRRRRCIDSCGGNGGNDADVHYHRLWAGAEDGREIAAASPYGDRTTRNVALRPCCAGMTQLRG